MSELYDTVYDLVRQIPEGCVTTYGRIAGIVGCSPRQVGYALHALQPGSGVPWHRVVGAGGRISLRSGGDPAPEQVCRLRAEGVDVSDGGGIDMARFAW